MTRRLNRFRRSRYDVLSAQPLESRLCLSAVSASVIAAAAADNESVEFEELEELVEEAHENGYRLELRDHHVPELVDDVIAHVAESLLIAPAELHELVIASESASPDNGTTTLGLSESESLSDVEAGNAAVSKLAAANVPVLTKLTNQTEAAVVTSEVAAENATEADSAPIEVPVEGKGDSTVDGHVLDAIVEVQHGDVVDRAEDGAKSPIIEELSGELSDEPSLAGIDGIVIAGVSETAIGIRYGSAFGLLSEQIRLPFSIDGASNDDVNVPARSNPASATSNATVLMAAALAGGVLAASNAPNSPAVQKIVRKIRRSIRPAV